MLLSGPQPALNVTFGSVRINHSFLLKIYYYLPKRHHNKYTSLWDGEVSGAPRVQWQAEGCKPQPRYSFSDSLNCFLKFRSIKHVASGSFIQNQGPCYIWNLVLLPFFLLFSQRYWVWIIKKDLF